MEVLYLCNLKIFGIYRNQSEQIKKLLQKNPDLVIIGSKLISSTTYAAEAIDEGLSYFKSINIPVMWMPGWYDLGVDTDKHSADSLDRFYKTIPKTCKKNNIISLTDSVFTYENSLIFGYLPKPEPDFKKNPYILRFLYFKDKNINNFYNSHLSGLKSKLKKSLTNKKIIRTIIITDNFFNISELEKFNFKKKLKKLIIKPRRDKDNCYQTNEFLENEADIENFEYTFITI